MFGWCETVKERGKSTFAETEVRSREEKKKKEANSMREEKLGKLREGGSEVGQTH